MSSLLVIIRDIASRGVARGWAPPPLEIRIQYKFLNFFIFKIKKLIFLQKNVEDYSQKKLINNYFV